MTIDKPKPTNAQLKQDPGHVCARAICGHRYAVHGEKGCEIPGCKCKAFCK